MKGTGFLTKRRSIPALLLGFGLLSALGLAWGSDNPNEKDIKPQPNALDKDEIYDKDGKFRLDSKLWVLNFRFKAPRTIKVRIPGRGERICWYLWYQVTNMTSTAQTFVPDFELVTQDTRLVYRDEILPTVQDAISALEDPNGILKIKNTVTITRDPIAAYGNRPNAVPRPVTGVAIWTDPNEPSPLDPKAVREEKAKKPKLSDTKFFSIFIAGLSNGWAETDGPGGTRVVRQKTLQLNFRRFGDGALLRDEDIRFVSHEWIYRAFPKPEMKKPDAGARLDK